MRGGVKRWGRVCYFISSILSPLKPHSTTEGDRTPSKTGFINWCFEMLKVVLNRYKKSSINTQLIASDNFKLLSRCQFLQLELTYLLWATAKRQTRQKDRERHPVSNVTPIKNLMCNFHTKGSATPEPHLSGGRKQIEASSISRWRGKCGLTYRSSGSSSLVLERHRF